MNKNSDKVLTIVFASFLVIITSMYIYAHSIGKV